MEAKGVLKVKRGTNLFSKSALFSLYDFHFNFGFIVLIAFLLSFLPLANAQSDTVLQEGRVEGTVHRMPQVKEHSPKKALILSAVLPGAGQVYNRQAWKVPIIYAALGGVGYYTYVNFTQMRLYKEEYLYRVNNNGATLHPDDPNISSAPNSNIYNLYENYNKTFQLSIIIAVAVYGVNLLDAYVYGHLFDFQISDDLTLNLSPAVIPAGALSAFNSQLPAPLLPAASLSLRF